MRSIIVNSLQFTERNSNNLKLILLNDLEIKVITSFTKLSLLLLIILYKNLVPSLKYISKWPSSTFTFLSTNQCTRWSRRSTEISWFSLQTNPFCSRKEWSRYQWTTCCCRWSQTTSTTLAYGSVEEGGMMVLKVVLWRYKFKVVFTTLHHMKVLTIVLKVL